MPKKIKTNIKVKGDRKSLLNEEKEVITLSDIWNIGDSDAPPMNKKTTNQIWKEYFNPLRIVDKEVKFVNEFLNDLGIPTIEGKRYKVILDYSEKEVFIESLTLDTAINPFDTDKSGREELELDYKGLLYHCFSHKAGVMAAHSFFSDIGSMKKAREQNRHDDSLYNGLSAMSHLKDIMTAKYEYYFFIEKERQEGKGYPETMKHIIERYYQLKSKLCKQDPAIGKKYSLDDMSEEIAKELEQNKGKYYPYEAKTIRVMIRGKNLKRNIQKYG